MDEYPGTFKVDGDGYIYNASGEVTLASLEMEYDP